MGSKRSSGSTTSLQSCSSISLTSSSQESSSDDEVESNATPTLPFSGLDRLTRDGSGPARSTRLASLLLGQGRAVSKMIGRARASAQPRTPAPWDLLRGCACDRSNRSARLGGVARTEELPALGVLQSRTRSQSQAQKALQRENTAGAVAPRGRRASIACCQKVSALGAAANLLASAHARPQQVQCAAVGMAKTTEELPSCHHEDPRRAPRDQRGITLAPSAAQSPQQVERPTGSKAHRETARFRRGTVSEATAAPKTLEALSTFVQEANHKNKQTSSGAKLRRPSFGLAAGSTLTTSKTSPRLCTMCSGGSSSKKVAPCAYTETSRCFP